jgi:site-specific DNA recombinase
VTSDSPTTRFDFAQGRRNAPNQVSLADTRDRSARAGLEQDFNSLDAQYDASQAYLRRQSHAGWALLRAKYDDGGFSGGNTDRPALQRLLNDVQAGKVDVIMVYKVDRLTRSSRFKLPASVDDRCLVSTYVTRVEIRPDKVVINLQAQESKRPKRGGITLHVPWRKPPSKMRREILLPNGIDPRRARPMRAETRATLVAAIVRGRRWLKELVEDATISVESIAKRERCSVRQVNMTISMAFLAPNLGKAAIEGRLPRGIGVERLRDAPIEWSRQHAMLGLLWQS